MQYQTDECPNNCSARGVARCFESKCPCPDLYSTEPDCSVCMNILQNNKEKKTNNVD